MCQTCGHDLLDHFTWHADVDGSTCRACGHDCTFVPPGGYSVSSDGTKPVLVLTSSLVQP